MHVLVPSDRALELIGALPDGVVAEVWEGGTPPQDAEKVRFWVPPFLGGAALVELLPAMPSLEVVQLQTAGVDAFVGRMPAGVRLCSARGVHTATTAEWVCAVMLAAYRELPRFVLAQAEGRWDYTNTDELAGKRVLVLGAGSIGQAVRDRLSVFEVEVDLVARSPRDGVYGIDALPKLLPHVDAVVVLLPSTDETRGFVDAEFLGRMRDGALLVNAARGTIVDTDALLAELQSGRLRAAVDVTDPEPLPPGHPLWSAPGLLLTPHVGASVFTAQRRIFGFVGQQLRRFVAGEPLENVITGTY